MLPDCPIGLGSPLGPGGPSAPGLPLAPVSPIAPVTLSAWNLQSLPRTNAPGKSMSSPFPRACSCSQRSLVPQAASKPGIYSHTPSNPVVVGLPARVVETATYIPPVLSIIIEQSVNWLNLSIPPLYLLTSVNPAPPPGLLYITKS